ncbi:hypothetical protein FHG87_003123 [Trinorchestia longiramus]|nr:hypothetical protein FHG87_003123 [Trinorchestia longiramus]
MLDEIDLNDEFIDDMESISSVPSNYSSSDSEPDDGILEQIQNDNHDENAEVHENQHDLRCGTSHSNRNAFDFIALYRLKWVNAKSSSFITTIITTTTTTIITTTIIITTTTTVFRLHATSLSRL